MSIVNSRSKFPSLFEKVRIAGCVFTLTIGIAVCFCVFNSEHLQGFVLRPGHENLVAMGAISTVADDAIKCKLPLISFAIATAMTKNASCR